MGFGSYRSLRVPLPNARHWVSRLAWTREERECSLEDFKRVEWSDGSRFRLLNANGSLKTWRHAHEAMDPACRVITV